MFKLTLFVCFMFIGTTLLAARMSCDSCGSECAPACGTRRFRSCCFNYLRKKREPEAVKFWTPSNVDATENALKSKLPYSTVENMLEQIVLNEIADKYRPYLFEDYVDDQAEVQKA